MKHYEPKHIAALSDRGFYTILTVCGLIIAASAWVLWMHAGSSAETAVPETGAPVITPAEDVPDLTVQDIPGADTGGHGFRAGVYPADGRRGADAVFGRYAAVSADARRLARAQRHGFRLRGRGERFGADRRHGAGCF